MDPNKIETNHYQLLCMRGRDRQMMHEMNYITILSLNGNKINIKHFKNKS